jgi:peptide/nickel transport system substrate-binding protein
MTPRRLWAAAPLLALAAGLASAATHGPVLKNGGIFRFGTTGASTQIDPQLSYVSTGWWLEYATAAKLYNYPDKAGQAGGLLRPEVASGFRVGNGGKTYTFTIRKGFRFSDGTPVTAKNFAYAITRARDPQLNSPAAQFITDIGNVRATGNTLVVHLRQANASLLTILAMPFFQATSTKLPLSAEVTGGYPSAGPYYFARNDVDALTSLRRNPYWKGNRPRNLAGVDVHWNMNEQTAFQQTLGNQLDEGPIPAAEVQNIAQRFGVNKSRFWAKPTQCMGYIVLNNSSGVFAGNAPLRRAVNWAIDRTSYAGNSYTLRPWTHILGPFVPGSVTARKLQPYGDRPNLAKARKLAAGHLRDGNVVVAYRSSGTIDPGRAQIARQALVDLGISPDRIVMKGFSGADIYTQMGVGNGIDMFVSIGWCSDYPGVPAGKELSSWLSTAGVHNAALDRKIAAAEKLSEPARSRALGRLDLVIMRQVAPIVPMVTYNNLFFLSNRVDPRSLVYQPAIQNWSIPALALK